MEKPLIYVTTGTNDYQFDRMLRFVEEVILLLGGAYEVFLQYGNSSTHSSVYSSKCGFISRAESENLYKNADIIFSHCGIGSIYNSLKYNTPTIFIPRLEKYGEFSDDHQLQIAKEIEVNPLVHVSYDTKDALCVVDFINNHSQTPKKEVDLINYKLSKFISERLYEG